MKTELLQFHHPSAIEHSTRILRSGGVISFPTDTVYGIAVSAYNSAGIERLYDIKVRSAIKAIAVLLSSTAQLTLVTTGMPDFAHKLADHFWPGALTLVVPRSPKLPQNISPDQTVGVRVPDHDLLRVLIEESGPLATTSANISGAPNSMTASDVEQQLGGRINLILDGGKTAGEIPSTVVDCTGKRVKILREGKISTKQIQQILANEFGIESGD